MEGSTMITHEDGFSGGVLLSAHSLRAVNYWSIDSTGDEVPIRGNLSFLVRSLIESLAREVYVLDPAANQNDCRMFPAIREYDKHHPWLAGMVRRADPNGRFYKRVERVFRPLVESVKESDFSQEVFLRGKGRIKELKDVNPYEAVDLSFIMAGMPSEADTPSAVKFGIARNCTVRFPNGNVVPIRYLHSLNRAFDLLYRIYLGARYRAEVDIAADTYRPILGYHPMRRHSNALSAALDTGVLRVLAERLSAPEYGDLLIRIMGTINCYQAKVEVPKLFTHATSPTLDWKRLYHDVRNHSRFLELSRLRHELGVHSDALERSERLRSFFRRRIRSTDLAQSVGYSLELVGVLSSIVSAFVPGLSSVNAAGLVRRRERYMPPLVDRSMSRAIAEIHAAAKSEDQYSPRLSRLDIARFSLDWGQYRQSSMSL